MYVIRTEGYDLKDKLVIGEKYMIPNLIKSVGFREKDIQISNQLIEFIIENYDSEIKKFAHVVPYEVIDKLEFPVTKKSKIA